MTGSPPGMRVRSEATTPQRGLGTCVTSLGRWLRRCRDEDRGSGWVGISTKAISTPAGRVWPPELPFSVIERKRLLDRVSQAVDAFPFTLISAPAGSGKTVLASAWARQRGGTRAVWLTLTSRDDQPVVFWSHVRFALAGIGAMRAEAGPGIAPDKADIGDIDALAEQM